jgi:hypothetical protein
MIDPKADYRTNIIVIPRAMTLAMVSIALCELSEADRQTGAGKNISPLFQQSHSHPRIPLQVFAEWD